MPDASAKPASAPSISATASPRASTVGFASREYPYPAYPPGRSATASASASTESAENVAVW